MPLRNKHYQVESGRFGSGGLDGLFKFTPQYGEVTTTDPSTGEAISTGEIGVTNKPNWFQRNIGGANKQIQKFQNEIALRKWLNKLENESAIAKERRIEDYKTQQANTIADRSDKSKILSANIDLLAKAGVPINQNTLDTLISAYAPYIEPNAATMANAVGENLNLDAAKRQSELGNYRNTITRNDLTSRMYERLGDTAVDAMMATETLPILNARKTQLELDNLPGKTRLEQLMTEANLAKAQFENKQNANKRYIPYGDGLLQDAITGEVFQHEQPVQADRFGRQYRPGVLSRMRRFNQSSASSDMLQQLNTLGLGLNSNTNNVPTNIKPTISSKPGTTENYYSNGYNDVSPKDYNDYLMWKKAEQDAIGDR